MPDESAVSSTANDSTETVAAAPLYDAGTTTDPAHEETSPPSDPSSEPQTGETAPESEPGTPKHDRAKAEPASAAEKRIKQLIAQQKQMQQRLDRYERPSDAKLDEPRPPREQDFRTWEDFEAAKGVYDQRRIEYLTKKAVQDDRLQREQQRLAEEQTRVEQETQASWTKRKHATLKRHADFDVAKAIDAVDANPATDGFIVDSEIGPDLLHYLQAHPDEAEQLREMSPYKAVRHMTKLEATLLDQIHGTPAKPLPRPPRTVDGRYAPSAQPKTVGEVLYGAD